MKNQSPHDSIEAAFNRSTDSQHVQGGSIEPRPLGSVATAANSTTIADLERKRRVSKAVIAVLSSLGTLGVILMGGLPPPGSYIAGVIGVLLLIISIVVAFFTNALTPAELDDLVAKLGGASTSLSKAAHPKPPDDAGKGGAP